MSEVAQYDVGKLLEMIGCRIRGRNRADCVRCKRFRAISFTADTFFCHGCGWKGNAATLEKELGIHRRLSPGEYKQLWRKRKRADRAARELYVAAHERLLQLREDLRELGRIELLAHDAGPNDESAWNGLAAVYRERGQILAELSYLENRPASDVLRFLTVDRTTRASAVSRVLERGGMYDAKDKFIEVNW